ncbi:MAG: hydroxyethylthiazole kinase [Armatimonadetes bacterium]|nr:hydroxyethylthiazole kinase [Armatimonadota bacterium]
MEISAHSVWQDVARIRERAPLVHNITNYVVMNSTANALLAIGASPVMAHAVPEVEDMVGIAGALVINIGTLSDPWIEAMERAMKRAQALGTPIVLDPVGAGATPYRTRTVHRLLAAARPAIIRGNASEIRACVSEAASTKGVDSTEGAEAAATDARRLAEQMSAVVVASGETDYVTGEGCVLRVANGHPLMPRVTGLGCTASALCGAFAAVNASPLRAAAHAMAVIGIAGELAAERAQGPGTLQLYFLDALYALNESHIAARLRATSQRAGG